jgi:TPR repeat protein
MQEDDNIQENAEQLFHEASQLVEENPTQALKLFRRAADLGYENAKNDIRWMYQQLVVFSTDFAANYEDDVIKRQIPEAMEYVRRLLRIIEKDEQWWRKRWNGFSHAYIDADWYTLDRHKKVPEFCDD